MINEKSDDNVAFQVCERGTVSPQSHILPSLEYTCLHWTGERGRGWFHIHSPLILYPPACLSVRPAGAGYSSFVCVGGGIIVSCFSKGHFSLKGYNILAARKKILRYSPPNSSHPKNPHLQSKNSSTRKFFWRPMAIYDAMLLHKCCHP